MEKMIVKKNFIILSMARSGTSSLARSLRVHPEIELLAEPFHKPQNHNRKTWYINQVNDLESFISTLCTIYQNHNGIKHMLNHVPFTYNEHLIKSGKYEIIYLYRNNILKTVISSFISRQAKEWGDRTDKILGHTFKPLPIKKLANKIQQRKNMLQQYREYLDANATSYFDLCYEDLYGETIEIEKRISIYVNMLKFLGFNPDLNTKQINRVRSILDPSTKLNSMDTYKLIPNIYEIEKKFGSPENGYLFQ